MSQTKYYLTEHLYQTALSHYLLDQDPLDEEEGAFERFLRDFYKIGDRDIVLIKNGEIVYE